jgi:hypothetical protein
MLRRDGRIFDWNIRNLTWQLDPPLQELLQRREGWPEGIAYWSLFDSKGRVLTHGPGLPTADTLYQTLSNNNVETPADFLRRFVREHPSSFEAKTVFLQELFRIASYKTRQKFGEDAGINPDHMLSSEDDRAIWGEYASLCRQVLQHLLNQNRTPWTWAGPNASDIFIHSRAMKEVAAWILPQLETSLYRQPTNDLLWSLWVSMSDLAEAGRSFRELKESLVLSPVDNPLHLMPVFPRQSLLAKYYRRQNWQGIIDIQEFDFARFSTFEPDSRLMGYYFFQEEELFLTLLEAYLRLDKNHEANELVKICTRFHRLPGDDRDRGSFRQRAIEVAEKCEKTALVHQWKRME